MARGPIENHVVAGDREFRVRRKTRSERDVQRARGRAFWARGTIYLPEWIFAVGERKTESAAEFSVTRLGEFAGEIRGNVQAGILLGTRLSERFNQTIANVICISFVRGNRVG